MFLFTQVGLTSDGIHQIAAVQNPSPVADSLISQSVVVLPKKKTNPQKTKIKTVPVLTVEQTVEQYFSDTPVLANIARCESRFRQFDEAGNVLRGKVNTKDVGVMQINELYHSSRAQALGLDLHTLKGNLAYANILYKEQGTAPWLSSGGCWGGVVAKAE